MKKIYVNPETNVVELKIENLMLEYSNSQAASDATVLSRGGSNWEDED